MDSCKYCQDRKHWAFRCDVRVPDGEFGSKDITVPVRFCPYCGRTLMDEAKPKYEKGKRVRVNIGLLEQTGWKPNGFSHAHGIEMLWFAIVAIKQYEESYFYELDGFPGGGWIPENCLYTI